MMAKIIFRDKSAAAAISPKFLPQRDRILNSLSSSNEFQLEEEIST